MNEAKRSGQGGSGGSGSPGRSARRHFERRIARLIQVGRLNRAVKEVIRWNRSAEGQGEKRVRLLATDPERQAWAAKVLAT